MSDDFDKGWFVGFAEAEGSFTSHHRLPFFSLSQNDKVILDEIKHCFGFGSVTKVWKKGKAWRYCLYSKGGLETFIEIFNGNLKSESKQAQFKRWITLFNQNIKHKTRNYSFIKGNSVVSHSLFDLGWLTGFIEGDGCFTYRPDGYPVLSLTQNDKAILVSVKQFFGFGYIIKHSAKPDCKAWRYQVAHNWDTMKTLRQFFKGRLKTCSKQWQFSFWCGLFNDNHPLRVKGREHERLRSKEYRQKNREKCIEAVKKWKRNNREKVRAYKRKWWHVHSKEINFRRRMKRRKLHAKEAETS